MKTTPYAAIIGWGMAVPERVITNGELSKTIDTSDEWIRTRTGILERRIAAPHETTSLLAATAGQQALEQAGVAPDSVELVILATCTPDRRFPATASTVQARLGLAHAGAFDLAAACSGFIYGLDVATNMIRSGAYHTVLLIGVDLFSHILNWNDRSTCVLFGDGAGAVVLQARDTQLGMLSSILGSWGEGEELMVIEAGGTRMPLTPELLEQGRDKFTMQGREIFKHAVREMGESSLQVIAAAGLTRQDIDLIIPHQANGRIIESLMKRLELPMSRVFTNLEQYGNTSAASIPIALCEAVEQGRVQAGNHILLTAFGGGLTWGSTIVRWGQE